MKFSVNQQDLQKSLSYCQGVIEKRSTLPILSNILLDINNGHLTVTATDLDLIFINKISNVEILEEGKTTTSSSIMYDIVRKISSGSKIGISNSGESKLQLESEKSIFNLNCISASEFPLTDENFNKNEFSMKSKDLLKLLNKCKFSISNDETRHYLSGIFFHQTQAEDKVYLTAVPRNVRLSEAPSHGIPVLLYDKICPGSKAYFKFTEEFLDQDKQVESAA